MERFVIMNDEHPVWLIAFILVGAWCTSWLACDVISRHIPDQPKIEYIERR